MSAQGIDECMINVHHYYYYKTNFLVNMHLGNTLDSGGILKVIYTYHIRLPIKTNELESKVPNLSCYTSLQNFIAYIWICFPLTACFLRSVTKPEEVFSAMPL